MALKTQYLSFLNFYVTFGSLFHMNSGISEYPTVENTYYQVSLEWLHLYSSIFPTIIS